MARGDEFSVVYVDGDVPQRPIQLGQLLVDSSQISTGTTNLQQCTSQDPLVYTPIAGRVPGDIRNFGAVGDGVTNDTAAIQAAIDANLVVYVPEGDYLTDTLTLRAGSYIYGDGAISVLRQNTVTDGAYGTLYANSGSSGTQIDDITIKTLQVLGDVVGQGFLEGMHLISLNGVNRATVRNCLLTGPRGDAIYIGSGVNGGDERHNTVVKILDNVIDGEINDNRNGVSIIDCDDCDIAGNTFARLTRSNMPGAIDIEPDNDFSVVRNIRVRGNHFQDCGGNVACISLATGSTTYTTQPETFVFNDNTFASPDAAAVAIVNSVSGYSRPLNVQFCNNSGVVRGPWTITSFVEGLVVEGNELSFTDVAYLGVSDTDICRSARVADNVLSGDGVTANCIVLRSGNGVSLHNNRFAGIAGPAILLGGASATLNQIDVSDNDCSSSVSYAVSFGGGTITKLKILDNDFSQVSTSAFFGSIPATTRIRGNLGYVSENAGVTGAVATGATVAHGCGTTPTAVTVTAQDAGPTDLYVTAIGATAFTINYGGGGTHVFAWDAKTPYYYAS